LGLVEMGLKAQTAKPNRNQTVVMVRFGLGFLFERFGFGF